MYEEQRLMAAGLPFSEASSMCQSFRRETAMGRIDKEDHPLNHTCKCGGIGNCPNCPNKSL